jgi:hypothetical protein
VLELASDASDAPPPPPPPTSTPTPTPTLPPPPRPENPADAPGPAATPQPPPLPRTPSWDAAQSLAASLADMGGEFSAGACRHALRNKNGGNADNAIGWRFDKSASGGQVPEDATPPPTSATLARASSSAAATDGWFEVPDVSSTQPDAVTAAARRARARARACGRTVPAAAGDAAAPHGNTVLPGQQI